MSEVRSELRAWIARMLKCKTLEEIKSCLQEFSFYRWTLEEKSIMSSLYSPKANKLLSSSEDKWRHLEDLEELCWTNKNVRQQNEQTSNNFKIFSGLEENQVILRTDLDARA